MPGVRHHDRTASVRHKLWHSRQRDRELVNSSLRSSTTFWSTLSFVRSSQTISWWPNPQANRKQSRPSWRKVGRHDTLYIHDIVQKHEVTAVRQICALYELVLIIYTYPQGITLSTHDKTHECYVAPTSVGHVLSLALIKCEWPLVRWLSQSGTGGQCRHVMQAWHCPTWSTATLYRYCWDKLRGPRWSKNDTPHQQHWADSAQKSLSNHSLVMGQQLPNRCGVKLSYCPEKHKKVGSCRSKYVYWK